MGGVLQKNRPSLASPRTRIVSGDVVSGATVFSLGNEPLVSVVIPTYNRASLCADAVEAALAQSWRPIEVIVVDDGSTDGTAEKFADAAAPVRYIRQENSERAAARNHGVKVARGELVAFLDSDDIWDADHIAGSVAALRAHPTGALAFSRARYVTPSGEMLWAAPAPDLPEGLNLPEATVRALAVDGIGFPLSSVVVQREVVAKLRFNEERALSRSEDWELWVRLGARFPVVATGRTTVSLRMHPGNSSQDADGAATAMERAFALVMADSVASDAIGQWADQTRAAMDLEIARLLYYARRRGEARVRLESARRLGDSERQRGEIRRLRWLLAMPVGLATSIRSLRRILARRKA